MVNEMSVTTLPIWDYSDNLESIAQAYKRLGYNVSISPKSEELPDFLRKFDPDLIAKKPGENIIVELKKRTHARGITYWLDIDNEIRNHPEWKLQLVDQGSMDSDLAPNAESSDRNSIVSKFVEAKKLAEFNYYESAVVLAFGATEAAMRSIVTTKKLTWDRLGVLTLISAVLQAGYLDVDQAKFLNDMMVQRGRIVHGQYKSMVDKTQLERLIEVGQELVGYLKQ